jgi:tRNA(Met) C34 N-acetyltransferase TmcA
MALLAGIGLQYKTIEQLATELNLPQSQLLALFNKSIKRIIDVKFQGFCQETKIFLILVN